MVQNQAYAAYNNSKILTASPAELTLMLYDGAIKFCNMGVMCIEKKDIPGANTNIKKNVFPTTIIDRYAVACTSA